MIYFSLRKNVNYSVAKTRELCEKWISDQKHCVHLSLTNSFNTNLPIELADHHQSTSSRCTVYISYMLFALDGKQSLYSLYKMTIVASKFWRAVFNNNNKKIALEQNVDSVVNESMRLPNNNPYLLIAVDNDHSRCLFALFMIRFVLFRILFLFLWERGRVF